MERTLEYFLFSPKLSSEPVHRQIRQTYILSGRCPGILTPLSLVLGTVPSLSHPRSPVGFSTDGAFKENLTLARHDGAHCKMLAAEWS